MPRRRKRFSQTTTPRYRAKMYDYLSRGGRIPSVIALEVTDAVTTEWSGRFGEYEGFKKGVVFPTLDKLGIPYIMRGIFVGQAMKIRKRYDRPPREFVEQVAKEVGLDEVTVKGLSGTQILLAIFGLEQISSTSTAGGVEEEQKPQS